MRCSFVSLGLLVASNAAWAGCFPISGTVQLTPEPPGTCTVATQYTANPGFIGDCYTFTLKLGGLLPSYGHAGVTSELMSSLVPSGGAAASPAQVQGDRNVLTARSTFTLAGTRFYAAEIIVDSNGFVTEQSVITGTDGKGLLRNASGGFTILGNSIGQPAQVRGEICTP
jgi:hypothetical protein